MKYAYNYDENAEDGWTTVEAASHQDASVHAFEEKPEAEVVYVGYANTPKPEDYIDLDTILDDINDNVEQFGGEWAQGWRDYSKEHEAGLTNALQKAFGDYLDAHNLRPTFFNVENIKTINRPSDR